MTDEELANSEIQVGKYSLIIWCSSIIYDEPYINLMYGKDMRYVVESFGSADIARSFRTKEELNNFLVTARMQDGFSRDSD